MRFLLLLPLLACLAPPALAFQTNIGGNAGEFLRLGAGARALGMGEAYGPVAEGPEAIYWNPAGLAQSRRPEVAYTRTELYGLVHHDFFAYAQPVSAFGGTLGASYTRLSQEQLAVVTNSNIQVSNFTPHSDAFAVAFAKAVSLTEPSSKSDREYFGGGWELPNATRPLLQEREPWGGQLLLGLSLKGVSEHLYEHSANAVALDGGAIWRPVQVEQLSLSFAFRNAFGTEKFDQENEKLPVELDFGAAWDQRWWNSRLVPAFEVAVPYFGFPYVKLGAEYTKPMKPDMTAFFRAGIKTLSMTGLDPLTGLTAGLGLRYRKLGFDFGFEPMSDMGEIYRFTVGYKW